MLAASLTMKQIFEGTKVFKTEVGGGERDDHACHVLHATSSSTCRSLEWTRWKLPLLTPPSFPRCSIRCSSNSIRSVRATDGPIIRLPASVPLPQPLITCCDSSPLSTTSDRPVPNGAVWAQDLQRQHQATVGPSRHAGAWRGGDSFVWGCGNPEIECRCTFK